MGWKCTECGCEAAAKVNWNGSKMAVRCPECGHTLELSLDEATARFKEDPLAY